MRLRKFRVRGFRCIHDSGLVPVGDLAALIGKNESGKTALLQALLCLNKDEKIKELDRCDEMWEQFEADPNFRIVEGTFELSEQETETLVGQVPGAPLLKTVHMFRCLEGPVQYEFPEVEFGSRVELDAVANTAFQTELQAFRSSMEPLTKKTDSGPGPLEERRQELHEIIADLGAPDKLGKEGTAEALQHLADIVSLQAQLTEPLRKLRSASDKLFKNIPIRAEVEKYIREKLHPRFVYFSEYKKIHGAIRIPQYLAAAGSPQEERLDTGEPLDKRETIDNLFYLAGLDPKKLEEIKKSLASKNKYLGECSDRLTKALRPTWLAQPIDIELIYDTPDVLWVRVADLHEDGTRTNKGPLYRRAAGFIWHFSFFVNFTAETQKAELKDAILLLDDLGVHLHPVQQTGSLDVLKKLARRNQIIYTTHSPFMIFDYTVGHLLTVELDRDTHLSTIRSTYWDSEPETLIPVLHALGAPEAFAGATRAMSRRPVVVVEGITDYQYITAALDLLVSRKPQVAQLFANVELVQANGSPAIGPLALYQRRRGREVVALYDNEPGARRQAQELKNFGFPEEKIRFCRVDDKRECDIEDVFTESEYLQAVNGLYQEVLKNAKYVPIRHELIEAKKKGDSSLVRIVRILESIWDDHREENWGSFDKKKVCDKLCDIMYEAAKPVSEKTLDRFERLFKDIAEALRPPAAGPPAAEEAASSGQSNAH